MCSSSSVFQNVLNASFFLAIAFLTSSFHHHLFPPFFLTFFIPHSSSHAVRTPSLKDSHKIVVSTSTDSSTLLSNFSCISFSFNFQTMRFTLDSFLTTLFSFLLSTLATSSRCCNSHGITFTSFKIFQFSFLTKIKSISDSLLPNLNVIFLLSRSTEQILTWKQIFEKSWEHGKDLFACFVDLEKAYDHVLRDKLWMVLRKYGVHGQLLRAIESFYCRPEVCVRVNDKQSKPFHVGVKTPARVRFVTSPFHCLHGLERQMQPST